MDGWAIAVDWGTSFTCAAVTADGATEVLEIGQSRYLPSVVAADEDGTLLTGADAVAVAASRPSRAERLPKRAFVARREARLADRTVPTAELATATIGRVVAEARRRFGDGPARAVVTHPAQWGETEVDRLVAAAEAAGLDDVGALPEPVAAAVYYASATGAKALDVGEHVAVYDLGGGTFDTAVLRRTAGGFELSGPPGGDPEFGGADVDEALREVVAEHVRAAAPGVWEQLWADTSPRGRRLRALQLAEFHRAKESLSERPVVGVAVDGLPDDVRITRAELEAAIREQLEPTVDELVRTVEAAGLTIDDLAAIYLTGGSSRIPLVSELISERTGMLPRTEGDPKAVVALGALRWITGTITPAAAPAATDAPPAAADAPPAAAPPAAEPSASADPTAPGTAAADAGEAGDDGGEGPGAAESDLAEPPGPVAAGGSRRRIALLVTAVVAVLAVITAVAIAIGSSGDDPDPVASSSPSVDPNPNDLTNAQLAILDQVSAMGLTADECESSSHVTGAATEITCRPYDQLDGPVILSSFTGDMDTAVLEYVDSVSGLFLVDAVCGNRDSYAGTWERGRKWCLPQGDYYTVLWTNDSHGLFAMAGDSTSATVVSWWDAHRNDL